MILLFLASTLYHVITHARKVLAEKAGPLRYLSSNCGYVYAVLADGVKVAAGAYFDHRHLKPGTGWCVI